MLAKRKGVLMLLFVCIALVGSLQFYIWSINEVERGAPRGSIQTKVGDFVSQQRLTTPLGPILQWMKLPLIVALNRWPNAESCKVDGSADDILDWEAIADSWAGDEVCITRALHAAGSPEEGRRLLEANGFHVGPGRQKAGTTGFGATCVSRYPGDCSKAFKGNWLAYGANVSATYKDGRLIDVDILELVE
jgi:hypothetical protein